MHIPTRLAVTAAAVCRARSRRPDRLPEGRWRRRRRNPRPALLRPSLRSRCRLPAPLAAGTYVMTPFPNSAGNACWTPPQSGCIETTADDSIRVTPHRPGRLGSGPAASRRLADGQEPLPARRGEPVRRTRRVAVPRSLSCRQRRRPSRSGRPSTTSPTRSRTIRRSTRRRPCPSPWAATPGSTWTCRSRRTSPPAPIGYFPWEPGIYAQGPERALARLDPRCQRHPRRDPDHRTTPGRRRPTGLRSRRWWTRSRSNPEPTTGRAASAARPARPSDDAQVQQLASDHEPLDLARPLPDLGQLGVAQVALDLVLGDVAVAAVDLDRGVRRPGC